MASVERVVNITFFGNVDNVQIQSLYSGDDDDAKDANGADTDSLLDTVKSEFKRFRDDVRNNPLKEDETIFEWFNNVRQGRYPMLYRMHCIIHCIPPSQIDNKRYF